MLRRMTTPPHPFFHLSLRANSIINIFCEISSYDNTMTFFYQGPHCLTDASIKKRKCWYHKLVNYRVPSWVNHYYFWSALLCLCKSVFLMKWLVSPKALWKGVRFEFYFRFLANEMQYYRWSTLCFSLQRQPSEASRPCIFLLSNFFFSSSRALRSTSV